MTRELPEQNDLFSTDNHITHIITRTHAPVAERSIRTIKEMIYKRLKGTDKPWNGEPLTQTLITYNYKLKHSATGFTPNEGREKKNELSIKLKLQMNAKRDRIYPNISVGDEVKVYKKKINLIKVIILRFGQRISIK